MNSARISNGAAEHIAPIVLRDMARLDVGGTSTATVRREPVYRGHATVLRDVHRPLGHAEAIYEGSANNLVGIKTFAGQESNVSPQHAVLLGMSGAGKSVTVCDLLTQTEGYFAYTVIIEEGLPTAFTVQT